MAYLNFSNIFKIYSYLTYFMWNSIMISLCSNINVLVTKSSVEEMMLLFISLVEPITVVDYCTSTQTKSFLCVAPFWMLTMAIVGLYMNHNKYDWERNYKNVLF